MPNDGIFWDVCDVIYGLQLTYDISHFVVY